MAGSLLAQPGKIGPLRLKNRLIMASMGTNFGTTDGLSTARDRHYYALRARGGVAAIVTEAMAVSKAAAPTTTPSGSTMTASSPAWRGWWRPSGGMTA
jgi:2,4-dienoyl-CoA reductase-like NADH-dependent reductase (Old Yellow Enzyme family)